MTIDLWWRIGMAGDPASMRTAHRQSRGDWAPPGPDSIAPGTRDGEPDGYGLLDYLVQTARAAESLGFHGGLLPSFPGTDDPWAVASALARETKTYKFMVAFQPGFLNPVQAARMTASLHRATGGRVAYNIITGGGGPPQLWWGDKVAHDDRYARTSEFLDVLRGVWDGGPFDFDGRFYRVEGGGLPGPLAGLPFPEVYFSGSSPAAIEAAGRHADYYLSWLEPVEALRAKFDAVRERSTAPEFAVRIDVLARETAEEAWAEVERGWRHVRPEAVRAQLSRDGGDSFGVRRALAFQPGSFTGFRDFEVRPNVFAGFALMRPGPAFGLVGSYEQVAERLDELIDLGVGSFILAGGPHLEEAYRVAEGVLPLLRGRLGDRERTGPVTARA
ncbi:LLM class flavin-dependent oxidoreductase [Actinosynnema sp. NPDC050436]|uniref:LLM class flavin-dependent oxidoreductase n=1 Tax=Actinosynnema sp. NPDC050436 TaxID=3155659 RepID=UPI0033F53A08